MVEWGATTTFETVDEGSLLALAGAASGDAASSLARATEQKRPRPIQSTRPATGYGIPRTATAAAKI